MDSFIEHINESLLQNYIEDFKFITKDSGLSLQHQCGEPSVLYIGERMRFTCSKCSMSCNIPYHTWMIYNNIYQNMTIARSFKSLNERLSKLEESVYNTAEYRALKIIEESEYDVNSINKS